MRGLFLGLSNKKEAVTLRQMKATVATKPIIDQEIRGRMLPVHRKK